MAKLPHQRTRLPGVDRFDIELNAFLRSCGFTMFFSTHDYPSGVWFFRDGADRPEVTNPALLAAVRLALIDPDTNTEPTRRKLRDGLKALGGRNARNPAVVQRMAEYQAAREAEYQAEQASKMPEDI